MEPLAALGAASSVLQIVDISCKILSKGSQLRTSFAGALPENELLEKSAEHLNSLIVRLRQQQLAGSQIGGQDKLDGMIDLCAQTAGELLDVLGILRLQGSKTRWKSLRAAVKSVWKKERIEEIVGRLEHVKNEIEFGVIIDLREELVNMSLQHSIRFNDLDYSTKTVLQAVLDGQSASAAAKQARSKDFQAFAQGLETLVISEHQQTRNEILNEIRQQQNTRPAFSPFMPQFDADQNMEERPDVLIMLKFVAIDDRHDAIPEAHKQTFEWIWQENPECERFTWSNFSQWLSVEEGIYWVTGKPGSGKSTLMKCIYHDSRTKEGLLQWANSARYVMATFFFWNSGSPMQKSLLGLLQGLLFEVLQKRPDLKNTVFPIKVQIEASKRYASRSAEVESVWTVHDLKSAFGRLLRIPDLRICLLIDGLDEFEGDDTEIAELFKEVITSPSVKACLSSRPLAAFERSFSNCPHLRIHELTHKDISLYVHDHLEQRDEVLQMRVADPSEFHNLVEEIIDKSSGVFLWVKLAVRSLLEGLTNFDRMEDLRFRLQELPDDLINMYWHILRGVKPEWYLPQAARLLTIMRTVSVESLTLRSDILAFAETYGFGKPLQVIEESNYLEFASSQATIMRGRLVSRCRGLLEEQGNKIVFLHQTVIDWLMQPDVQNWLEGKLDKTFSPHYAILAGFLTEIKNNGDEMDHCSSGGEERISRMFWLARKAEENLGMADIRLTEEIDLAYRHKVKVFYTGRRPGDQRIINSPSSSDPTRDLSWAGIAAHRNCPRPAAWNDTFMTLSMQRGLTKYLEAMLGTGMSMYYGPEHRPLLDFVVDIKCVYDWVARQKEPRKVLDIAELLLNRGADPNEEFRGRTVWENVFWYANGEYPFADATFVENFYQYRDEEHPDMTKHAYIELSKNSIWIDVMQIFLKHGADPNTGLVKPCGDGLDQVIPASRFVADSLLKANSKSARILLDELKKRGGRETAYKRAMKEPCEALAWSLLPKPAPEDISGKGDPSRYADMRDWSPPKPQGTLKPQNYPDHEGMIAVHTSDSPKPSTEGPAAPRKGSQRGKSVYWSLKRLVKKS